MAHYIYLVRHGEQQDAEHGMEDGPLSARGVRQAQLLADRLSGVPFTSARHSPLVRASETARIFAERLPALDPQPHALLFDCVPTGMTEDTPAVFEPFFGGVTEEQIEAGSAQMADAANEFLVRKNGEVHELLITHNFVIASLVCEVLGAPAWRWMTLNQANCGLTIISQRQGRPWTLIAHNDLAHLPFELRTGVPDIAPV
ncbi:MAG: histidine phosphatase family protein [Microbacterium sp.]